MHYATNAAAIGHYTVIWFSYARVTEHGDNDSEKAHLNIPCGI